MARGSDNSLRETIAPAVLFAGDALITFAGLGLGFWLRYHSPVQRFGIEVPNARFADYAPLMLLGGALLIAAFANLGLYDSRMLLRRFQSLNIIIKGCAFWLLAYLCVSLVLKFEPPISRLFVLLASGCVLTLLYVWRTAAFAVFSRGSLRRRLQRRAVLLGWSDRAGELLKNSAADGPFPFLVVGVVTWPGEALPEDAKAVHLGSTTDLETVLDQERIDLAIAMRLDVPRNELQAILQTCERSYVEWKMIPATFDIFLNGLRLHMIGKLPVLGIEDLAITKLFSRVSKRLVDVVGAVLGLLLSAPIIVVLAALIRRESPGAPVIFRQTRVGASHRPFTLYKLRSMHPEASLADDQRQSTRRADPRLLRIGSFMRRWNLDELPQFWNVLRGQMSLVGPRPERPFHVERLSAVVPHYLPRHLAKPGMTGWAQVHGFRGEGNIDLRIQHDIYYIENWTLWLDCQILLLTLVRWRNSAE